MYGINSDIIIKGKDTIYRLTVFDGKEIIVETDIFETYRSYSAAEKLLENFVAYLNQKEIETYKNRKITNVKRQKNGIEYVSCPYCHFRRSKIILGKEWRKRMDVDNTISTMCLYGHVFKVKEKTE